MQHPLSSDIPTIHRYRLERFTRLAGIVVPLVGFSVLMGWSFNIEPLKRVLPGLVSMNPMTAVAFILAGFSLSLLRERTTLSKKDKRATISAWFAGLLCAILLVLIGAVKLANWAGVEVTIDQWLFANKLDGDAGTLTNRIAPNTALNFVIIGSALALIGSKTRRGERPAQYLAALAALIALLALIAYAYRIDAFDGAAAFVPMAVHTAGTFLLLSIAVFCARPNEGWMHIFTSESPGGMLARLLLPSTVLVVVIVGGLRLEGERRGLYSAEIGVLLYTGVVIVLLTLLVGWTARCLHAVDIARKHTAEQVQHLNADLAHHAAQLEAANKELESFSYSVSHDLRAPLRHVQGFVELLGNDLKEAPVSAKAQRYLKIISDAAGDMGMLVDDLLAFSRVGRVEMRQTTVDLEQVVRAAITGLEPEINDRNIEWTHNPLPMIQGDPSLIRQVYANLVSNALKYSRPRNPAKIEIGCEGRDSDGRAILFVRDNGVGFDMQYASKLFGVFQRLHRADEFEGTGIGLANVHRIVTRHGGRIWAEAAPERGATFYFTLNPSPPQP